MSIIKNSLLVVLLCGSLFNCKPSDKKKALQEPANEALIQEEKPIKKELTASMSEGKKVYDQYCLICHQPDGSGVPGLNPPLIGTEYVLGDKGRLVGIILNGSNEGLEIGGGDYTNAMPGFKSLTDKEIALVASFIRNSFGNSAVTIDTKEVKDFRASFSL